MSALAFLYSMQSPQKSLIIKLPKGSHSLLLEIDQLVAITEATLVDSTLVVRVRGDVGDLRKVKAHCETRLSKTFPRSTHRPPLLQAG